uniref:Uncharacterized protein n=1 Tax=Sphaerodactylus townsendi TaxID=933632 RepID=A0ACB8EB82_9SAUR
MPSYPPFRIKEKDHLSQLSPGLPLVTGDPAELVTRGKPECELVVTVCLCTRAPQRKAVMGSGMSQIVEGLYLGNIRDSEDKENLEKHGITHILSVHNNAKPGLEG